MTAAEAGDGHTAAGSARIPSLDGLRALAIGLVLMMHVAGTVGAPAILGAISKSLWVDLGELGVRIFFVISGLLITSLLLEEQRKYGAISLGRFILRRTFRIFPAYLAFLLALWVAATLGGLTITGRDWVHALTYTLNYHVSRPWELGHIWSLSVEEQFYALWPALLVFAGTRRAMILATVLLFLAPVLRIAYLHLLPDAAEVVGVTFETAADSLAIGCLLAWHRDRLWANERWRRLLSSRWLVPAAFLVAYLLCARTQSALLLGHSALNLAAALLIERSVRLPDRGVGRMLNATPIVFIGVLSYSLYLWQQPFLNRHASADINQFPLNLVLAFTAALVSYYCVERPGLWLRQRIESWLPARTTRRQPST